MQLVFYAVASDFLESPPIAFLLMMSLYETYLTCQTSGTAKGPGLDRIMSKFNDGSRMYPQV